MKKYIWRDLNARERETVLARPLQRTDASILRAVEDIFADVRARGDEAVAAYAERFDGRRPYVIEIDDEALEGARAALKVEDIAAIEFAAANIAAFHAQTAPEPRAVDVMSGLVCEQIYRPIARAGLYAPAGTAPLVSTLMMLAIPARQAGVEDLVVATPPSEGGRVAPAMILAAGVSGVDRLHVVGGAHAIAAMAVGTQTISRVDKVFGPGGAYVAAAKAYAAAMQGGPAIDLPAGPSELLVIADETAEADVVAADLLGQAEHDALAQVVLVTTSPALAERAIAAAMSAVKRLPRRDIARASLNEARCLIVDNIETAVDVANIYAPEHLSLHVEDAESALARVSNAGAVFVGPWAAEAFGDYVNGPCHVLPTDGAARAWSGVSTASFMRAISVQRVSRQAARVLAPAAVALARLEGLEAHARSVLARETLMVDPVADAAS